MNFAIRRILYIFIYNFLLLFSFGNKTIVEIKISGGYRDDADWFKYVASIRTLHSDALHYGNGHYCGGTIITVYTILTAAHCFYFLKRHERIRVVVGSPYRLQPIKTVQILSVSEIKMHEKFHPVTLLHDIALLQLSKAIEIDDVNTAIMPLPIMPPNTDMGCTVAGWGHIYYKGPSPDKIVYANLRIVIDQCKAIIVSHIKQICAYDFDDIEKNTCQADSGGPLICLNAIYGITSYGPPCGLNKLGGVYTNVYAYSEWIERNKINAAKIHWTKSILIYIFTLNVIQL